MLLQKLVCPYFVLNLFEDEYSCEKLFEEHMIEQTIVEEFSYEDAENPTDATKKPEKTKFFDKIKGDMKTGMGKDHIGNGGAQPKPGVGVILQQYRRAVFVG